MRSLYQAIEKKAHASVLKRGAPTFEEYIETRKPTNPDSDILNRLGTIDGNIASLLTHVSAMIAATGILLIVFNDAKWTQFFVLVEMFGYCLVTIFLIINLPFSNPVPRKNVRQMSSTQVTFKDSTELRYNIYISRRYIYVHTAYAVLFLTISFALTIFAHASIFFLAG